MGESESILSDFDKLWDYDRADETERRFVELLPAAETSGNANYLGQLLTQIARTQGRQRKFDQAHSTLDQVQKLLDHNANHHLKVVRIRYELERGRVFNSLGHAEEAIPHFEQAADLAQSAGQINYQIDAVHMIAIATSDPNEKIAWNLQALKLIEIHPDQNRWFHAVYNNLGEAYVSAGKYDLALDVFRKIIELETARGKEPAWYMKKDIARCLRLIGKPHEALAIMQPLADEEDKTGQHNGWISEELAEDLAALGRMAEARPRFQQAHEIFAADPWEVEHEPQRLAHLKWSAR